MVVIYDPDLSIWFNEYLIKEAVSQYLYNFYQRELTLRKE